MAYSESTNRPHRSEDEMLQHTEQPTIDRKRERFLTNDRAPSIERRPDVTSAQVESDRKRYLRSVPSSEREHASAWLEAYGDLLTLEPTSDTLDRALGTSEHALGPVVPIDSGAAYQAPTTLVTLEGEPVDVAGVWSVVLRHLTGDPVDDRSEHAKRAQRALESAYLKQLDRGRLSISLGGLRTTGDLTISDGVTGVTHLAGEVEYHLDAAYETHRKLLKREATVASNKRRRDEKRETLRAQRAARESISDEQRSTERDAAKRGLKRDAVWQNA